MTTDITTVPAVDHAGLQGSSTAAQASSALASWAGALADAGTLAKALCMTEFVPTNFRGSGNIGSAAVAIMRGSALGLDPIASLESIYVISGKPAMYARAMVAVVVAKGHKIWTEESQDTTVTVCGMRAGSDKVERSTWTIERAQRAGYTKNAKYQSNPQEMLYAKAATEVARRIAPDALMGLSYAVEELELEQAVEELELEKAVAPVKIKRRRKPEPIPEPVLDVEAEGAVEADE